MYIQQVNIENIRSIRQFEMKFEAEQEAGWHVLIGDNGSGKTTILRSIALGLIGETDINGLRENWNNWLTKQAKFGLIAISTVPNQIHILKGSPAQHLYLGAISLKKDKSGIVHLQIEDKSVLREDDIILDELFFSSAFGPYRRFSGGSERWDEIFRNPSFSRLASHLSLFGEDVALTEITSWLQKLHTQNLEKKPEGKTLDFIKTLINSEDFLPHATKLSEVSSDGVFFTDGNGEKIGINQLSDGYRSILSLTLELIRQMILSYGADEVFNNISKGEMSIPLPGVVLVDEIDAHLHPTWQTRIGQWFTQYFPQLQFIVTTHSPLVCRACEKGSIWRLAAPGSEQASGEITGSDRDRLIYGNVLDAYGTEVFGKDVSISKEADERLSELAELNVKSLFEDVTAEEKAKMQQLKSVFPSNSTLLKHD